MAKDLDTLSEFEQFRKEILPALRRDIKAGLSNEEIYKKYQAHTAARSVTIALTDPDSGKALAAIKEIHDRGTGKPKERQEVTHRLDKLADEQLDALLQTQLERVNSLADKQEKH